jgi:NarL family two-component system response regulator LiaR
VFSYVSDGNMRVLIIDGHDIFQQGLEKILQCEPGIEVVSHCGALWEKAVIENKPDIVIIDICLEQINPFELIRQVLQSEPNIKFVVLTYSELRKDLISSFEAGVSAYISKHIDIKNLIQVINRVSRGEVIIYHPSKKDFIIKMLTREEPLKGAPRATALTRQEQVVMSLVEEGRTNQEIADTLVISPHTVKVHMRNIMEKLQAPTRQRAAYLAREQGLIDSSN